MAPCQDAAPAGEQAALALCRTVRLAAAGYGRRVRCRTAPRPCGAGCDGRGAWQRRVRELAPQALDLGGGMGGRWARCRGPPCELLAWGASCALHMAQSGHHGASSGDVDPRAGRCVRWGSCAAAEGTCCPGVRPSPRAFTGRARGALGARVPPHSLVPKSPPSGAPVLLWGAPEEHFHASVHGIFAADSVHPRMGKRDRGRLGQFPGVARWSAVVPGCRPRRVKRRSRGHLDSRSSSRSGCEVDIDDIR
jgi:hypothetical protein